jgi:hypothetical protein
MRKVALALQMDSQSIQITQRLEAPPFLTLLLRGGPPGSAEISEHDVVERFSLSAKARIETRKSYLFLPLGFIKLGVDCHRHRVADEGNRY